MSKVTTTVIETTGTEPVTTADMKLYCHVDNTDEDGLFPTMITAARQYAEHKTGRILIATTYDVTIEVENEETEFVIPLSPCLSLTSVSVDGVALEDSSLYSFSPSAVGGEPVFATFKTLDGFPDGTITVRVSAGACTEAERQWVMVRVNNWYEQRATFGIGPNFHEMHHDFVDALLDITTRYGAF